MWLKLSPNAFRIALQVALVSLLDYWAGSYFTRLVQGSQSQIGALWATISGVVIMVVSVADPRMNPLVNAGLRFGES